MFTGWRTCLSDWSQLLTARELRILPLLLLSLSALLLAGLLRCTYARSIIDVTGVGCCQKIVRRAHRGSLPPNHQFNSERSCGCLEGLQIACRIRAAKWGHHFVAVPLRRASHLYTKRSANSDHSVGRHHFVVFRACARVNSWVQRAHRCQVIKPTVSLTKREMSLTGRERCH